jgi:hypothetical protein
MTIALTVKVHDGIVLAADSASTFYRAGPGGALSVANVYNNANKIFTAACLRDELGAMLRA